MRRLQDGSVRADGPDRARRQLRLTRSVYEGFFHDPRYKPSLIQKDLVDAGWLGRKSGRGFYDHREGVAKADAQEAGALAQAPREVLVEGELGAAAALADLL